MTEPIIHITDNDSEADTCRKDVLPKIYASNWTDEQILEQRTFTDGKIVVLGRKAKRKKAKRFDYLLRYSQNFPIAIVEAKVKYKEAADGMQQAKEDGTPDMRYRANKEIYGNIYSTPRLSIPRL